MKTKRLHLLVPTLCLLAMMTALPAAAQAESPWSFSFDTTFTSQYLWRGFVLNDTPSLQPNISVGYKGFSVSSWSNFAHTGPYGQNWTEHDLTVDYSHSFNKLGLSAGYIWYTFPDYKANEGRYTHEFYVGASYDTLLSPSFTYYRDVDQGDGNYFYGSIGHSVDMGKGVALNLGTGVGINNKQWIDRTVVSNWDINVSVDIPIGGKVTLSPFFTEMVGAKPEFGNHNMFGVAMSLISLP